MTKKVAWDVAGTTRTGTCDSMVVWAVTKEEAVADFVKRNPRYTVAKVRRATELDGHEPM